MAAKGAPKVTCSFPALHFERRLSCFFSKLVPDGESSRQISLDEVKKHSKPNDAWVIIHGKVYDVTKFLRDHPGGPEILQQHAGVFVTEILQCYR